MARKGSRLPLMGEAKVNPPSICDECPCSMTNRANTCARGIGNRYGFMLVLPPVTTMDKGNILNNRVFKEFKTHYEFITASNIITDAYVTAIVKCGSTPLVPIDESVTNRCKELWYKEVRFQKPKIVLLIGLAVELVLGVKLEEAVGNCYHSQGVYYFVNYNPLVKHFREDGMKLFASNIQKFARVVKYRSINEYKLVMI